MLRTVTYSFFLKKSVFIIIINTIKSAKQAINTPNTGIATTNTAVNITANTNINNINKIIIFLLS